MTSSNAPDAARRHEERTLADVHARLDRAVKEADQRLSDYARDIQAQKNYLWENRDEMDHIEKISARESIEQSVMVGDNILGQQKKLLKLQRSPYFGRLDFSRTGVAHAEPVYIGIHHFYDEVDKTNRVYDWRAPISTLFYDYETGPASYQASQGEVHGEVSLKRQFRIKHRTIELMIESAINVVDDVLQEELGRTSDEGMKTIVATIQRDQNSIIRNEHAKVLIIQGVAGSGKTSIALHRIAFLLYRFKDTLSSKDVLIISPNRVFASYIANVLPELGEESVNEIDMETLATELLDGEVRFQTFFEQTTALLEKEDAAMKQRLQYKATAAFLQELTAYAAHVEKARFEATDLWVARRLVPAWLVEEVFRKHRALAMTARVNQVALELEQKVGIQYNVDLMPEDRKALKTAIRQMIRQSSLRETYKHFFTWLGKPELFKTATKSRLEWADVFPLIYLKSLLEGVRSPYTRVKHLLVDEMQDYSTVQYAVIAKLFNCKKTILGDIHQSVNPYSSSRAEEIKSQFVQAAYVTLNKSYRSSYEITGFAQRISPNPDLEAIERHGEEPLVLRLNTKAEEYRTIADMAKDFNASPYNTLAIICKTQKQADRLFAGITDHVDNTQLLNAQSHTFTQGVLVCTAHMAKGLEFDQVIIPDSNEKTYATEMDRNLLYVACTRAMHRLCLTYTGKLTAFVAG